MIHEIIIDGYIGEVQDFFGETKCFTLYDLQVAIAAMPKGITELNVKINSGGGLSTEGFAIHDELVAIYCAVNCFSKSLFA